MRQTCAREPQPSPGPDVGALLERHRGAALRAARATGLGRAQAEDVVQDVFLRLLQVSLEPATLGALVRLMTVRRSVDVWRACERERRREEATAERERTEPRDIENVVEAVAAVQLLALLRSAVSPNDLALLRARAGGASLVDVAAELGVSAKAAECAIGRARAKCRAALGSRSEG